MGAFPSLHVGASIYLCLFDLRTSSLRGLTYAPIVLLIYAATLVLRFHYVVDLVAGTLIGLVCTRLGPWAFTRWARARQDRGLPALAGGEGDVLPGFPAPGGDSTRPVLSAH
jgi:membrane-associated phospholipid phosphatase